MLDRVFLRCSSDHLRQYDARIAVCLKSLKPEQVWTRGGDNENAIGNLVLHLCGNVRQWLITGVGGAQDIRRRDEEFAARTGPGPDELASLLHSTVEEAVAVIESLSAERLTDRFVIQGYEGSVLEAVYHVVEHFSMHTGQILFATKLLTGADLGFYRHLQAASHNEKTP